VKQGIVEEIEAAAAAVRWFQRFHGNHASTFSAEELAEWARWSADREHLEQFRQVKELWRTSEPLARGSTRPTEKALAADEYDGSVSVSDWLSRERLDSRAWRVTRSLGLPLLAAACAVMFFGVSFRYLYPVAWFNLLGNRIGVYATATSEHRSIQLSDGTTIT